MADSPNRTQLWLGVIGTAVAVLTMLFGGLAYVEDRRSQAINNRVDTVEYQLQGQIDNIRKRIDRIESRNWQIFQLIGDDIRELYPRPRYPEPPP